MDLKTRSVSVHEKNSSVQQGKDLEVEIRAKRNRQNINEEEDDNGVDCSLSLSLPSCRSNGNNRSNNGSMKQSTKRMVVMEEKDFESSSSDSDEVLSSSRANPTGTRECWWDYLDDGRRSTVNLTLSMSIYGSHKMIENGIRDSEIDTFLSSL